MGQGKMIAVQQPVFRVEGVHSIGVIGDPGCEGLGIYNMKIYASALEETAQDDITLVVGDLVPVGTPYHYRTICDMTRVLAENDVYALRGNHDTGAYADYFGRKNYALLAERFALVVLDNAERSFEEEGLTLLSQVLDMEEVTKVIVAFHIPVPNHFIQNCVSQMEFERLRQAYEPHREKMAYLLCGHVHSRFVDEVDGIPLICTGGGGAMIEDVSESIRAWDVEHHVVHFYEEEGALRFRIADLPENGYSRERDDPLLRQQLEATVQGELLAHFRYLMFADRAQRRGMEHIAQLFRALAASEYYHARSFFSVLEQPAPFKDTARGFIPGEAFEYEHLYPMLAAYARDHGAPLAEQAYLGAARAEKKHGALLKDSAEPDGAEPGPVYVCPICGYIMTGGSIPDSCPVCGGPRRQYEAFGI